VGIYPCPVTNSNNRDDCVTENGEKDMVSLIIICAMIGIIIGIVAFLFNVPMLVTALVALVAGLGYALLMGEES
jgi:hypothetical protein